VTILNSPDIHGWPITTTITALDFRSSGLHIDFTKRDGPNRWPDIPFGVEGGSLQYTVWIVLNINGQWYGAGCVEYWGGLDRSGGPPSMYSQNWYYDPIRWGPMSSHQPAVGEQVGFLITSGDARHLNDFVGLHERSNIVTVPFPSDNGAIYTFRLGRMR
jgi:hypothetical protein